VLYQDGEGLLNIIKFGCHRSYLLTYGTHTN